MGWRWTGVELACAATTLELAHGAIYLQRCTVDPSPPISVLCSFHVFTHPVVIHEYRYLPGTGTYDRSYSCTRGQLENKKTKRQQSENHRRGWKVEGPPDFGCGVQHSKAHPHGRLVLQGLAAETEGGPRRRWQGPAAGAPTGSSRAPTGAAAAGTAVTGLGGPPL